MEELKDQIIGFLNMGLHPTVISFQDDGLYYLFDELLQGKTTSNSYDPTFTFVHVTLADVENITTEVLEQRINEGLTRDNFEGDTVFDTYMNDVETVCVLDDISFLDNVETAIQASDALIRKYRGVLHFVYVVEDPMLVHKIRKELPATSNFLESLMYQEIGKYWTEKSLTALCKDQFKRNLSDDEVDEVAKLSNNHLGTFKRLYKDKLLGTSSAKRYVELMVEGLDASLLNTFKKIMHNKELTSEEKDVFYYYNKVGFVDEKNIAIPMFREIIDGVIVMDKINYDKDTKSLSGLDLDLLTKVERNIIKTLFETDTVLTKTQIGDIIWGDEATEKYSDWAIDQRIARLRKKIIDLGFNIDIQTVYGQGYSLVFIDKK